MAGKPLLLFYRIEEFIDSKREMNGNEKRARDRAKKMNVKRIEPK